MLQYLDKSMKGEYIMNILDKIQDKLKKIFSGNKNESNAPFVQWIHKNMTKTHCYT